jgi:hypothetical protein
LCFNPGFLKPNVIPNRELNTTLENLLEECIKEQGYTVGGVSLERIYYDPTWMVTLSSTFTG